MEKGMIIVALAPARVPPGGLEKLRAAADGRDVRLTKNKAEAEEFLDNIEIGIGDVPFSLLSRMPRLKWIQLWSAGADWLQNHPEVKALPFRLTTTSGMHGAQMTEHLFAMLLAWNRRLDKAFAARARREWLRIGAGLSILGGKTMLILGYGSIGRCIAKAAPAFGMKVIGIRRQAGARAAFGPAGEDAAVAPVSALSEHLPAADIVVNILPLTPETFRFFGKEQFAAMKRTALYCNIGRGATTDEAALVGALKEKMIAGALLDVTETEPLPQDSPLWDMDNVLITGHYAGLHPDYDTIALETALDNLGRYVRNEPLRNLVDKTIGY
ncbi:MAG: D-2-hydroxyacid dehydrogenase [Treponema sp.]|jgi:phosphoglycerate dehydrogenase-like enzyme|nr:D-2-hydroxyacid dehydrogenase [Treponema sp.]